METKGFLQFEIIIIDVLISFFHFIWIPMVWVYDHYKYFNSFSAGIVYHVYRDVYRRYRSETQKGLILSQRRMRWSNINS